MKASGGLSDAIAEGRGQREATRLLRVSQGTPITTIQCKLPKTAVVRFRGWFEPWLERSLETVTESKMGNTVLLIVGYLLLCSAALPQEQPRDLKGAGHVLGETAEQFFSEGQIGDLEQACDGRDWKTVKQLSKTQDYSTKKNAKDICAKEKLTKQQATSGTRLEYDGRGDDESMRTDTFTFDRDHLVKIDMVYLVPIANVEGSHPKSFAELFDGLQEAYGPPSQSYQETVRDIYGVKYEAHRATWMRPQDVISIVEQPGTDGRTEIVAETVAEHNRAAQAPKSPNPLQ